MERRPIRPKSTAVSSSFHKYGRDEVAELATQVLEFLGRDVARLTQFLDATGLAPENLRAATRQDDFGASLLDYLASDEALFRTFAEAYGHDPALLDATRLRLSGVDGAL